MGRELFFLCEVVGIPELDLETRKEKQDEPRQNLIRNKVLCMNLPIETTGVPTKNSAGSKTRGRKLL